LLAERNCPVATLHALDVVEGTGVYVGFNEGYVRYRMPPVSISLRSILHFSALGKGWLRRRRRWLTMQ